MVNFSSLKTQAEMALAKLTEGKYYEVSDLNQRLQKAASDFPQDTVIKAVARVVEQLGEKDKSKLISQGDIEKIYNELIGLNVTGTKFREVLGDLLVSDVHDSTTQNNEYIRGMRDDPNLETIAYDVNIDTQNELNQLFDNKSDKYDPKLASAAKQKIDLELKTLGFDKASLKLVGGNSKLLVFSANFDTNRGSVRVLIPSSASGTQFPDSFVVDNKINKLTKANLNDYLLKASEKRGKKEAQYTNEIELPPVETPEPLKMLASQIEDKVVEASVGFSPNVVNLTKNMLVTELGLMGFKNSQIKVASPTKDGFICEAVLNTPQGKISIEMPIEIANGSPLLPAVFAKDDFVANFDESSLHNFVSKNKDNNITRVEKHFDEMSLGQLKDSIVKAASQGDLELCDKIMAIINVKFDNDTYRNVVADYHKILISVGNVDNNIKMSYDDSDQFVKTPNSMYPIHKKLGKPAHELIRDEKGVYHLKSTYLARKNKIDEGAFFNTSKALIGD